LDIAGVSGFNPRAHAGRDNRVSGIYKVCFCFNPRAHAGRDNSNVRDVIILSCFNPRAHAGRDDNQIKKIRLSNVSIHAPTRGATYINNIQDNLIKFQSTRPRGARHILMVFFTLICCFNPRAHAGRDAYAVNNNSTGTVFQSTRPRGARRWRYP